MKLSSTFTITMIMAELFGEKFNIGDKMTTEPFQEIPFDGIMGLGFKDLSMGNGFNIVDDLAGMGAVGSGQFSFFVSDGDDSEVTFGGYRSDRLASDIVWAPVERESWWQVAINDITFNNKPQNLCDGKCQVAVDTGTSMLAGPSDLVDKLTNMVNAKDDCSNFNELPNLGFKVGDTVLNLKPDDYMDRSANGCSFSLMALDVPPPKGPVFIFGDPFLRRFVTIYDRNKPAVGFAVAKHEGGDAAAASELIVQTGGAKLEPRSSGGGAGAVNLHLSSGNMNGDSSSSDDASASEAAPTTAAPAVAEHAPASDDTPVATPEANAFAKALDSDDSFFHSQAQSAAPSAADTTASSSLSSSSASASASASDADDIFSKDRKKVQTMDFDSDKALKQLFRDGSFIQKPQKKEGLISVKLHRTQK